MALVNPNWEAWRELGAKKGRSLEAKVYKKEQQRPLFLKLVVWSCESVLDSQ
jgi:hypothetical protein